ncbi:hypothetical protein OROHE_008421 [Orobanche hederae]
MEFLIKCARRGARRAARREAKKLAKMNNRNIVDCAPKAAEILPHDHDDDELFARANPRYHEQQNPQSVLQTYSEDSIHWFGFHFNNDLPRSHRLNPPIKFFSLSDSDSESESEEEEEAEIPQQSAADTGLTPKSFFGTQYEGLLHRHNFSIKGDSSDWPTSRSDLVNKGGDTDSEEQQNWVQE